MGCVCDASGGGGVTRAEVRAWEVRVGCARGRLQWEARVGGAEAHWEVCRKCIYHQAHGIVGHVLDDDVLEMSSFAAPQRAAGLKDRQSMSRVEILASG